MGNSATEALIIGVNVFIFVIALTIAIFLMNTVTDMSDRANEVIKSETGSMIQTENDKERIITGSELIYYSQDKNIKDRYKLCFNTTATELGAYLNTLTSLQTLVGQEFTMTYKGIDGVTNKAIYVFEEYSE